jgi:polyhydroxyalkanoate synthase
VGEPLGLPALAAPEREELDAAATLALETDRLARAYAARLTLGVSPAALGLAFADWWLHLAASPGKLVELQRKATRKWLRYLAGTPIEPLAQDRRFSSPAWQDWPFKPIHQAFLFWQQWWHNATTGVHGVSAHHEHVVNFATRQLLDLWSPSNLPWTNPEVIEAARERSGMNFVEGAANFADDLRRELLGEPPAGAENFVPGKHVALTAGSVVLRNRLIELIQYKPATAEVHAEPVLIVPAWIMKYYILDLTPETSLVKYLVDRGHTVFMLSWKNPGPADRDLGMEDYLELGVMQALEAVGRIVPERKVHLAGYCLGGTLAAVAAAAMGRDGDARLAGLTLFAGQVDFEEAGELTLFIDNSEVSLLEDLMRAQGYLDARQMAGAFQLLRSNDLVWSRRVRQYLLGRREAMNALLAWNADSTRMPYRMHSGYLRRLFLNNDLSAGRYEARGRRVALSDIRLPLFALGTTTDHVAPWRSVYKVNLYTDSTVTFVLTTGGHNAGIASDPSRSERTYQLATRAHDAPYVDPDTWAASAAPRRGSWWPEWQRWLAEHSCGKVPPPTAGIELAPAPGQYVLQR